MALNQWIVYARFDASTSQWSATVGDRQVTGSMHDVVLALNVAHYRIISVVPTTHDLPATAPSSERQDAYVKGFAIFVDVEG